MCTLGWRGRRAGRGWELSRTIFVALALEISLSRACERVWTRAIVKRRKTLNLIIARNTISQAGFLFQSVNVLTVVRRSKSDGLVIEYVVFSAHSRINSAESTIVI